VYQYHLGWAFLEEGRLPTNSEEAISWFKKSAANDHDGARIMLAVAYYQGKGVEKDLNEARKLLAIAGAGEKDFFVRQFPKSERDEVLKWYDRDFEEMKQKAEAGDAKSMHKLAMHYHETGNESEALKCYQSLAEMGDVEAYMALGNCHADGLLGLKKDYSMAFYWQNKAAEKRNFFAMLNIVELYMEGDEFLPKNDVETEKWIQAARDLTNDESEKGHVFYQFLLGCAFSENGRFPTNTTEANEWFWKAANNGHGWSYIKLAVAHYRGSNGVERDLDKARELLDKGISLRKGKDITRFFARQFPSSEQAAALDWYNESQL
jgi:TPR repeat protein